MAFAITLLQILCCLGLGATVLRLLKIDRDMRTGEHWSIAFAVGFGALGWLVFPLGVFGYLSAEPLAVLLIAGAMAALLLRRPSTFIMMSSLGGVGWGLLVLLGVAFAFDVLEAVAPPADGDTLAYHFAIPKHFLEEGRINFIPQAVEGAVPYGVQMTYVPALVLGGEMALTLWTMLSGWAAAGLLFILCRRHLNFNWSLALTLIYLTTPAVIYGGGSGQVEPRIALFVMVAAWATARALKTGHVRYAILAGFGGGFFAATKYTGLLFASVTGLVHLFQRRWLVHGAAFGVTFIAAGFQWYAWNTIHTGDPVFPMLFQWLGREDLAFWNQAHNLVFKDVYFRSENPWPHSPLSLLLYPFKATLNFAGLIDTGRVGLGPYGLLVLPFAVLGFWRYRDQARGNPLLIYASLAFLFYVLWFFVGGSQRIRHLLPVLPLFLICVTVAAERFTATGTYRKPLIASMAMVVSMQMAVHGIFALNYIKFQVKDQDRQVFLKRNVEAFQAVPWINANLKKSDRILIRHRQLRYYLNIPVFFASPFYQSAVELRRGKTELRSLHRQLRSLDITHLLLSTNNSREDGTYSAPFNLLLRAGCLEERKNFYDKGLVSRTLQTMSAASQRLVVLRLKDKSCTG